MESAGNLYDSYVKDKEVISWKNATDLITLGLSVAGMGMAGKSLAKDGKALKAVSQGNVNVKPAAVSNSTASSEIIKNRYPNETQMGKRFNYVIENGKIHIENGIQNVDFVIDMYGDLHLGRGRLFLANTIDVQAAGTLKVNSQGYVRAISNGSGHYTLTVEQGKRFPDLLNNLGIRTKNAWLELGDYSFTPSGYVDLARSSTIVEQLK